MRIEGAIKEIKAMFLQHFERTGWRELIYRSQKAARVKGRRMVIDVQQPKTDRPVALRLTIVGVNVDLPTGEAVWIVAAEAVRHPDSASAADGEVWSRQRAAARQ